MQPINAQQRPALCSRLPGSCGWLADSLLCSVGRSAPHDTHHLRSFPLPLQPSVWWQRTRTSAATLRTNTVCQPGLSISAAPSVSVCSRSTVCMSVVLAAYAGCNEQAAASMLLYGATAVQIWCAHADAAFDTLHFLSQPVDSACLLCVCRGEDVRIHVLQRGRAVLQQQGRPWRLRRLLPRIQ